MALAIPTRTRIATALALAGFAANSLLCRAALRSAAIDAWSFTAVRLVSGAIAMTLLARIVSRGAPRAGGGSFASAFLLYAYAAAFSLAYLRLPSGVGALVLFATVQATMIGVGVARGSRPSAVEWTGVAIAVAGLLVLTLPGATMPDPVGVGLMAVAGVAWGAYSLRGRSNRAPLAATSGNFARSVPFAIVSLAGAYVLASGSDALHAESRGAWLALASGALASGLGYSLWYLALPELDALHAAVVQLTVPVWVGIAGILLLGESLTARLALAAPLILGGVACAVLPRARARRPR
jgi:drug/metabolite transporter (DMT)-like permease